MPRAHSFAELCSFVTGKLVAVFNCLVAAGSFRAKALLPCSPTPRGAIHIVVVFVAPLSAMPPRRAFNVTLLCACAVRHMEWKKWSGVWSYIKKRMLLTHLSVAEMKELGRM